MIRTLTPFRARSLAAIRPLGPPPTTITSVSAKRFMSFANSSIIAFVTALSEDFSKIGILSHQNSS